MNKIFTIILALLITSTSLNAQFSNKKIKGNGNIITTDRSVSDFDKIGIAGSFDVILKKGNEGAISIQADENLMEYIITEVRDRWPDCDFMIYNKKNKIPIQPINGGWFYFNQKSQV